MRVEKSVLLSLVLCFQLHRSDAFVTLRPIGRTTPPLRSFVTQLEAYQHPGGGISNNNNNGYQNSDRRPRNNHSRQRQRQHPQRRNNYPSNDPRVSEQRRAWLQQATANILITEPGSLIKGKWHELVSMLKAWSRYVKNDPEAPIMIERLLKRLLDERRAGNKECKADIHMYNVLLDAWACSAIFHTQDPSIAAQRAREILVLLQETYEREKDPDLQPNSKSFVVVFDAVLKTEGPIMARRVLAWMEYLQKVGRNIYATPPRKHYIMLLNSYANSRGENAGHLAEGFIRHMNATGVPPDTLCYNIAIKAWTKAKRGRESAEHADRIFEDMDVPKDIVTYATVISAWATSGMRSHAVARAEEVLQAIEEASDLEPNTIVLNTVMSTWVKSRNPAVANRTAEILNRMENSEIAPPDLISYNTHLHGLAIHGKRPGYARKANDVLDSLESRSKSGDISFRPNLFTYNLAIDAWSRSQEYDAAWNAVKVLRKLIDEKGPEPDTFSFNQVLSALSRSTKPGAARLAEQLVEYMEDAYKMKIHRNAKPDVIGYTSVIVALTRSGEADAAERAEKLLDKMKERYASGESYMKPNRMCYNALIDCWAKSGKGTYGARKAEALLQEMDEMCAMGDITVAPNIVTYNAVLNSWARSGTRCCANKAEKYLALMWELYNSGDGQIAPNDKSFNTVINAISKSQNEAKAQKALRILRRMDKLYQGGYKDARPNEVTYTSVLNSCAFPATLDQRTRRKALDTAIFTLQELQASGYGQPNEVTYGTFIKACSNLLSDDDKMLREVIENAFQQCCKDGQVGEMVLSHLREAAPEDLYKKIFAEVLGCETTVNIADLPPEWSCNVREETTRTWRERDLPRRERLATQKSKVEVKTNKKIAP